MKMYLLYEWYAYEGDYGHSIWEEKELAEMWAEVFSLEQGDPGYYGWSVTELEVYSALKEKD